MISEWESVKPKKGVALVASNPLNQVNVVDLFQALQIFSLEASYKQSLTDIAVLPPATHDSTRTITPDLL